MNFLRSIRADLVDKRLLPVVVALVALAILVPVGAGLLSGSGSSAPAIGPPALTPPPPGTPSPATALAVIAGPGTPPAKHYTGRELDPFRVRASTGAAAATAAAAGPGARNVTASSGANPTAAVRVTTAKGVAKAAPSAPAKTAPAPAKPVVPTPATTPPPAATPATPVATPSPKAQLAKLTSRESYSVDMSVVDAAGARRLAGVERLSPLPAGTNPLVEYLGVLGSRRAVAFLVNPATVVAGPGACLPKASDCQVLVLRPGQVEALAARSGAGAVAQASIAVTGWRVVSHSSVAAARQARSVEVKQGRTLVTESPQPALAALVYTVAQGAVAVIPSIVNALPAALSHLLGG